MISFYTEPSAVSAELRTTEQFASTTVPSLESVSEWILEYSDYIDSLSQEPWVAKDYEDLFSYDGNVNLYLRHSFVNTVNSLEYNTASEGNTPSWITLVEDEHYLVDYRRGYLKLITKNIPSLKAGFNNLRVSYNAGFLEVPARIKLLATKLVAAKVLDTLLNQNVNERNDGGSISVGDIRIVEPGSYGVDSYRNLKADIGSLERDIVRGFRVYRYG